MRAGRECGAGMCLRTEEGSLASGVQEGVTEVYAAGDEGMQRQKWNWEEAI